MNISFLEKCDPTGGVAGSVVKGLMPALLSSILLAKKEKAYAEHFIDIF
jgi:hypothetical protein